MQDSKHTPGPWETKCTDGKQLDEVWANGFPVCQLHNGGLNYEHEHQGANARLIAVAPDLLEMVQHFIAVRDETERTYQDAYHAMFKGGGFDWNKAKAIIAKAHGV